MSCAQSPMLLSIIVILGSSFMTPIASFLVKVPFVLIAMAFVTIGLVYASAIPDVQMRLAQAIVD